MDAQNKLKMALGELMLQQINLAAQLEALLEENKLLKQKLSEAPKNDTDATN